MSHDLAARTMWIEVYGWCMTRTNIDIDDDAVTAVMRRYGLKTKKDAVDFALRKVVPEPLTVEVFNSWRNIGWDLPDDAFDDLAGQALDDRD